MAVPAHLVHVYGVNDGANREDLRDIFSRHATVVGVDLIGKGCALVGYKEEQEADDAIKNIKFEVFEGRILKLQKSILFTPEYLQTIQDHNYGICLKFFFCYNFNVYFCLNALPGEICLRGKHSCFYCFVRDGVVRAHRNRDQECPSRTLGWQDMPQFSSAEIRKSARIPQTEGQPRQPGPVNRAPVPVSRAPIPVSRAPVPVSRAPIPVNRAPIPVEQSQSGTTSPTDQPREQPRFKFKDRGHRPTSSLLSKFEGILSTRTREELVEPIISNLGDIIRENAGPGSEPGTQASGRQENALVETGGGDEQPRVLDSASNPHETHNPACVSSLASHDSHHFYGDSIVNDFPGTSHGDNIVNDFPRTSYGDNIVNDFPRTSYGDSIVNDFPRTSYAGMPLSSDVSNYEASEAYDYGTMGEGEQGMVGPGGPGPGGICPRNWRFQPEENLFIPERTQPSMAQITNLYANSSSNLYRVTAPGAAQGTVKSISSLGDSFGNKVYTKSNLTQSQSSSSTMSRMSGTKSKSINISGIHKLGQVNENWFKSKENRTGSVLGPITKYSGTVTHSPVFRTNINSESVPLSDSMGGGNWGGNHCTPWMSDPIQSHPWDDGFNGGVGGNWGQEDEDNIWF